MAATTNYCGRKGLVFKEWMTILLAIVVVALILSLALMFVKQWL